MIARESEGERETERERERQIDRDRKKGGYRRLVYSLSLS